MEFWVLFLIYLVGFLLIFVDIFLPGGILATCGAVIVAIGVITTYVQHGTMWGTAALLGSALLAIVLLVTGFKVLTHSRLGNLIFLDPTPGKTSPGAATVDTHTLVGKEVVAETYLRPAGRIQLESEPYDAISSGGYIPPGSRIRVVGAQMNYLVVERV